MRRLGKVLGWLLLGLVMLPLAAFVALIPFLGVEDSGTAVGASLLFGASALVDRAVTAFTFSTSFDAGIPESPVLAIRSDSFGGDDCSNFTIVRLPQDAPAIPQDWAPPNRAEWQATPGRMMPDLTACDLEPVLQDALRKALSQPGSFVLNAHDSFAETRLYSAPQRIAARAVAGD